MIYISGIMIYLLALVAVGLYKIRSVKNSTDFMVAGRTLPWYILVGKSSRTWMGSGSLFSGAGLGYRNGLAALWSSGGAWLGIALIYFITRRIRNFGKVTVPDIFEARYGQAAAVGPRSPPLLPIPLLYPIIFRGGRQGLAMVPDGMINFGDRHFYHRCPLPFPIRAGGNVLCCVYRR
ncbi:MAG: hypothetical protein CM1200mP10_33090 [Candidatus Neomarinimicrobiota bacterium]|nr:MAG: hypothetical protein CM1200mP10_33090 [Candidatus Neomarinimicrobiota bacterium]